MVLDTSNRCRVVSDVVGDDSMQFGRRTDVKQAPSRLAAPSQVAMMPAHGHPAAQPDRAPASGIARSGRCSQKPDLSQNRKVLIDVRDCLPLV